MSTPTVIVHHPIPVDVDLVLRRAGYRPAVVSSALTEYRLETVDTDPSGPLPEAAGDVTPRLLYRPEEAARMLGIGRTTVYGLLKTGQLRSVQVGSCRRITASSIKAYVAGLEDHRDDSGGSKLMATSGIAASPNGPSRMSPLSRI